MWEDPKNLHQKRGPGEALAPSMCPPLCVCRGACAWSGACPCVCVIFEFISVFSFAFIFGCTGSFLTAHRLPLVAGVGASVFPL